MSTSRLLPLAATLMTLACGHFANAAEDDYIWTEGEEPSSGKAFSHPWYSEAITKNQLSGGAWISSFTDASDTELSYEVTVPKDGTWTLWVRANPINSKLSWKSADGDWKLIDQKKSVDQVNIANDNKPDLRFLAWTKVEAIPLKAGKSTISFKFHSDASHHGALDCFLLTTKAFSPTGARRPGGNKAAAAGDPSAYVWVEGEDAVANDLKPHPWYSNAVKKELLSGDAFLSTYDGPSGSVARYEVDIAKAGEYQLWLRANTVQSKVSWKLGDGAWTEVDTSKAIDVVNIANDGKPDLRLLGWMRGGALKLEPGKATLSIRFDSAINHHGSLDCFVLAAKPFNPSGKQKPGVKSGDVEPGWFAFEPEADEFAATALLDLRALNEKRAGETGSIKAKDDGFVRGDGSPIRFWAANAGAPADHDQADYLAARLAKTGVNLARFHGGEPEHTAYAVKTYADQGIYILLSTYFPLWKKLEPSDGIEGGAVGQFPFCLLFFEPKFQQWYKDRVKTLLTTPNPHTGKTLAEDPAVAFFEIQNEDSFFFWSFGEEQLGPGPWGRLEQRFAQWLTQRHGSLDKARAAWSAETHKHDASDRMGLFGAFDMTGDAWRNARPGRKARIGDQVRFLAELQRDFYIQMRRYLKEDLKFNGLVTASNWTTSDNRHLGGIERWSYAASADVVDRHGYFGGKHEGDNASWSVRAGHTFVDKAAVLEPMSTPIGYLQIAGRPHIHTEIAWNKPNRFNADGDLLVSAYAALQGVDAFFFFATDNGNWVGNGTSKWQMMMPGALGQFPATALQYRRGDVKAAPTVLRQVVSTEDVLTLKAGGIVEGENADFRIAEQPKVGDGGAASGFDPLTYFAGRAERVITDLPGAPAGAKPEAMDLAKYIDRAAKTVTSVTNELRWNWGTGIVVVNTPASQAATGFLAKAGTVKLGDVTIESRNEYGTIHVISLDNAPLATSKRILVQAYTEEKMSGWKASNGRIEDVGHAPILVREIDATVTFAQPTGWKATVLDGHGYAHGEATMVGGKLTVPKDALYTILSR